MNGYRTPDNWRERFTAAEQIEDLEKQVVKWAVATFVAICLACVLAVLLVRSRSEKVSDTFIPSRRVSVLR